jgi:hypothetical protein
LKFFNIFIAIGNVYSCGQIVLMCEMCIKG